MIDINYQVLVGPQDKHAPYIYIFFNNLLYIARACRSGRPKEITSKMQRINVNLTTVHINKTSMVVENIGVIKRSYQLNILSEKKNKKIKK